MVTRNAVPSWARTRNAEFRCVDCQNMMTRRQAKRHDCKAEATRGTRKRVKRWKRKTLGLALAHGAMPTSKGRAVRRATLYAIKRKGA